MFNFKIMNDNIINEAYNRLIQLIVNDSHLIGRAVININVLSEKKGSTLCRPLVDCMSVKFRYTGFTYKLVGVSKINTKL